MKCRLIIPMLLTVKALSASTLYDLANAILSNDKKQVTTILKLQPSLIKKHELYGLTPLQIAVRAGNKEITQLLLDNGADVNESNKLGEVSLKIAINDGNRDIVQILLNNGADIRTHDSMGNTIFNWALMRNASIELLQLLLDYGADVNSSDTKQITPLHFSALWGMTDIVELLLQQPGINPFLKDKDGNTALDNAMKIGYKKIEDLIKAKEEKIKNLESMKHSAHLKTKDIHFKFKK